MIKAAAVLSWIVGFGFGLPCAYAAWYFATRGDIWTFLGFPTYGSGPFEKIGIQTSIPLLLGFLLVCLAEVVVGGLLWRETRIGAVASIALLPLELAFWVGFALPAGPLLGIPRTILVLMAWSSLSS